LNETLLIQQLQQGNRQAFTQLVLAHQHMVHNTVLSIVQHVQEAEDVSQEVFVQVFESIGSFRAESKLSTWVYRIAITKALDCERKRKAKKRVNLIKNWVGIGNKEAEEVVEFHHPGVALDKKEEASVLFKALQQLPQSQRTAFTLIKAEGLSYEETSAIMQTSIKAIEALMHRAKENLRKILKNYYQHS
jgi:RNA polymerase sigma factor (sigma-70 family)